MAIAEGPLDRTAKTSSSRINSVVMDRSSCLTRPVFRKSMCRSSMKISQVIPAGGTAGRVLRDRAAHPAASSVERRHAATSQRRTAVGRVNRTAGRGDQ